MIVTFALFMGLVATLTGWAMAVVLFPTRGRHTSGEGGSR